MAKYLKRPIPVDAYPWDGEYNFNPEPGFRPIFDYKYPLSEEKGLVTLEGVMRIAKGDYIVKGPYDEYWAVRADIFPTTYVEFTGAQGST